jgi:hypothetical protein
LTNEEHPMSTTGETTPTDGDDTAAADEPTPGSETDVEEVEAASETDREIGADEHEARLRRAGVEFPDKPEGPIAAAILAGGIGCLALGVLTTLAEASTSVHDWLEFNSDVGPLSGKTIVAVAVWLVSWAVLHVAYRDKPFETRRAFTIALVLIALGVIGTFPTFFQAFTPE